MNIAFSRLAQSRWWSVEMKRLWRVPVLIDGEEIGDVIGTFEDLDDEHNS